MEWRIKHPGCPGGFFVPLSQPVMPKGKSFLIIIITVVVVDLDMAAHN